MFARYSSNAPATCMSASLLSGRNVRWPRRVLPLVSHGEYADGTDGRTDGRTPNCYNTLSDRLGQRNKPTHAGYVTSF